MEKTNSGDIEAGIVENITKEISLTGPIPSEYKLELTAVDIYGNVSTKSKELKIEDTIAPTCEIVGQAEKVIGRHIEVETIESESLELIGRTRVTDL